MRIVRLATILVVLSSLLWWASPWVRRHFEIVLFFIPWPVILIDVYLMTLLPAKSSPLPKAVARPSAAILQ